MTKAEMMKAEMLERLECECIKGMYFAETKRVGYVQSWISYNAKTGQIVLCQDSGRQTYKAVHMAKSHEKAVNLLARAEKDFKGFDKRGTAPYLATMLLKYESYLGELIEMKI
jgi:hypothetical protein